MRGSKGGVAREGKQGRVSKGKQVIRHGRSLSKGGEAKVEKRGR